MTNKKRKNIKSLFERGFIFFTRGKFEDAIIAFNRCIKLDPNDAKPWYGKGIALAELQRYQDALEAINQSIKLDPNSAPPWYEKGNVFTNLQRYQDALNAYDHCIKLGPNDAQPWYGKGIVLARLQRYQDTLEAFNQSIKLDPNDVKPWYGKGNALFNLKRYQDALEAYDHCIKLDPNDAYPWYGKGIALAKLQRYQDALEAYDHCIKLDSKLAYPWLGKGDVFTDLQRYQDALEAYDHCIKLDPNNVKPWYGKGNVFNDLQRYQDALEAINQSIKLDPNYADPWDTKGDIFKNLQRYQDALEAYDHCIKLDPNDAYPWYGKGIALAKLQRYQDALEAYDHCIKLDSKLAYPWLGKGDVFTDLQRYQDALKAFNHCIKLDPNDAKPWYGKGHVLAELQRYQDALEAINQSIKLDPNSAPPWYEKGNVFTNLQRYQDALEAYDHCIKLDSKLAYPWLGKGDVFTDLQRYQDALEAYDHCIKLDSKLAYPWLGKGDVFYKLANFNSSTICFIRSYKLCEETMYFKIYPEIFSKFNRNLYAPLFIYKIIIDNPEVITSLTWKNLIDHTLNECTKIIEFIEILTTGKDISVDIKTMKIIGLITLYMGNPLYSFEIFNQIDTIDDTDLLGQYYFVESLNGFGENTTNELNYAVKMARNVSNNKNKIDKIQLYYAGLLFCKNNDYNTAKVCFQTSYEKDNDFLPPLYMLMYCFHVNGEINNKNKIIKDILRKEKKYRLYKKPGFLKENSIESIDETLSNSVDKVVHYAYQMEITEAILLVLEWQEEFDKKNTYFPSFDSWSFIESLKVGITVEREKLTKNYIKTLNKKLKNYYTIIPFSDSKFTMQEIENKIAIYISDKIHKDFKKNEIENIHLLINYYFFSKKLYTKAAILLHFFLSLKEIKLKKKNYKEIFVRDLLKSAFIISGTKLVWGNLNLFLNITVSSVGVGFFSLISEYLSKKYFNYLETDWSFSYNSFKKGFYDFINSNIEKYGDDFYKKYQINNFYKLDDH